MLQEHKTGEYHIFFCIGFGAQMLMIIILCNSKLQVSHRKEWIQNSDLQNSEITKQRNHKTATTTKQRLLQNGD